MTKRMNAGRGSALVLLVLLTVGCGAPAPATDGPPTPADPTPTDPTPADLVIHNVRLFDGETVLEGATVVVRDGRIAAAGRGLPVPEAREVVDGAGRTLLPGLIDAHTHTFADPALIASLAFGVTTVLDMFTGPEQAAGWRAEQAAGGAAGRADLYSAGIVATAAGGHGTQYGMQIPTVDAPGMAAAFVADRVAEGSDWLKIILEDGSGFGREIPSLDAPRVSALVAAAHEHDLLAVVHVGVLASARIALDAGADGLVHMWIDRAPDAAFARRMREAGMFVVPTLTVLEGTAGTPSGASLLDDDRVAPLLDPDAAGNLGTAFPVGPDAAPGYDSAVAALRVLHDAGVPILAGSDAPNPGTTHGASMHRELELLVDAGVTPMEALRAATSRPADAFGLDDRGRIRPGARADLVLVAGDPTADIRATRAIERVWKGGAAFDRAAYRQRMADLQAARMAADTAPGRGPTLISDFDDGTMDAAFGLGWGQTTDARMGGSSTVATAVEPAGEPAEPGDDGVGGMALRITGETRAGVPYPWSGAMFSPASQPMAPANLSGAAGIAFRARGDGQTYQLLLFHEAGGMAPVPVPFITRPEWTDHFIPWSDFRGADGRGVIAIAFVAGGEARTFELWLDDVALSDEP